MVATAAKGSEPRYFYRKETMAMKLSRPRPTTRVKNKNPSPIQITAEQILSEARQVQAEEPKRKITDSAELDDYHRLKREQFENLVRRDGQSNPSAWVRYARWEESQKDFNRARSVWERALDAHRHDHSLYLWYAKFETKNKFINHARNVWERAVSQFPRVDRLWHKYIHMEEILGNVAGARQIFERWMDGEPEREAWLYYIRFELRYDEIVRASKIYQRSRCQFALAINFEALTI